MANMREDLATAMAFMKAAVEKMSLRTGEEGDQGVPQKAPGEQAKPPLAPEQPQVKTESDLNVKTPSPSTSPLPPEQARPPRDGPQAGGQHAPRYAPASVERPAFAATVSSPSAAVKPPPTAAKAPSAAAKAPPAATIVASAANSPPATAIVAAVANSPPATAIAAGAVKPPPATAIVAAVTVLLDLYAAYPRSTLVVDPGG